MLLRFSSLASLLAVSTMFVGALATPAHAYLDPGTGSMILQIVLGGIAGVTVAGKFYWHRFKTLLGLAPAANRTETPRDEAGSNSRAD